MARYDTSKSPILRAINAAANYEGLGDEARHAALTEYDTLVDLANAVAGSDKAASATALIKAFGIKGDTAQLRSTLYSVLILAGGE